ncbi:MAG: N-acetylmuramic acid 6-phosphate etherase, partial [Clostridia bacterium]|nr:N-acetylmuramic acid 6-phosphate etherase [Clostridia bacterium]
MELHELKKLATEGRNPRSAHIDTASPEEIVRIIGAEDKTVAESVEKAHGQIAKQIEAAAYALQHGGRLIYFGAGTSGRLGVMDAAECRPTYGVDDNTVIGLIAGGMGAMFSAVEGAEDSLTLAEEELRAVHLTDKDFVVGIAASGRTPYVKGGLSYARSLGCVTGSIACTSPAEISAL